MLKSSLRDYSDAYMLLKGIVTLIGYGSDAAETQANRKNKREIFENSEPFTDCITKINNAQADNAKDDCNGI